MDRKKFLSILASAVVGVSLKGKSVPLNASKKNLIVYFSWSGNTRSIAKKIESLIDADIAELQLEKPYSSNYNKCLDEAKQDQKIAARPKLKNQFDNIGDYDTVLLGYPNWWGSIPMPIATLLQSYNFDGKNIIPFCSHGGGRLGQSFSAITKLCPKSNIKSALAVYYSGGKSVDKEIAKWLSGNAVKTK